MEKVSWLAAFLAGIASFLSPCVLPLIPGYISFISGISLEELKSPALKTSNWKGVILNSLLFILGFSLIFIILGATATVLGGFFQTRINILNKIAGLIVIVFGLQMAGILRLGILSKEKRFQYRYRPWGPVGAFFVGLAFACGWTPCVGPILGAILAFAATQETIWKGIVLLGFYSFGLGLPLFITALALNAFLRFFQKIKRYMRIIEVCSGAFLVLLGVLIFTNSLVKLTGVFSFLNRFAF